MSIDSAEKRKSLSGVNYVAGPGVTPNASKDAEWRQQVGYGYSGISAADIALIGDVIVATAVSLLPRRVAESLSASRTAEKL